MPLVAHSGLPTFERLRVEGHEVLDTERARHQDIRELHIGFLNLMPDAALQATERQFFRLLGSSNRIVQFFVHPFTVDGVPRAGEARRHVERYYETFAGVQGDGLDALLISGANPANPDLRQEGFWPELITVLEWAQHNVCSVLCSCLATHVAVKQFHGIERTLLPRKRWGVYSHDLVTPGHPLVTHINTRFDAPHSHLHEVTSAELAAAGCQVLAASAEADLHLAVSGDGFRFVYFQGHPEYDVNSLLKEYKREVKRYIDGVREDYPPFPQHYFDGESAAVMERYREAVLVARSKKPALEFPERQAQAVLHNTWTDTGKAIFNNWLGLVYQVTHPERGKLFMEGVNPEDPLQLRQGVSA